MVIVSDEENKTEEKKIEIVNLENIKIKKEGKKRKSKETKHQNKPSKVPKKSGRPTTKTKTADVITLSSSSSGDDDNDDVIIEQGFKRKVHGIFMKPFVGKHKPNDVIEKVDITDENVKHPKYKLYQSNKDKALKSPISQPSTASKPVIIPPITVEEMDSVVSGLKSAISVSKPPSSVAKAVILSPITVEDSKDRPVVIPSTPIEVDHSQEQSIDDLECHTQNIVDDSVPTSMETSSQIQDSSNRSHGHDSSFTSDLVIERKVDKEPGDQVAVTESKTNTENTERKEDDKGTSNEAVVTETETNTKNTDNTERERQSDNVTKPPKDSIESNVDKDAKVSEESTTKKETGDMNEQNNVETKLSSFASQDSTKTEINIQNIGTELEIDTNKEKSEIPNCKELKEHLEQKEKDSATQDIDKLPSIQTPAETTVIPETPPSIVESSSSSKDKRDSDSTTGSQSTSGAKEPNISPNVTSDVKNPDIPQIASIEEGSSTSNVISINKESNSNTRNQEVDLESKKTEERDVDKTEDTSSQQTSKKKTVNNKYSGISAFLSNFEGHSSDNMADETREEPSLKEQTNAVAEQPTIDEETRDYQESMDTTEWKRYLD